MIEAFGGNGKKEVVPLIENNESSGDTIEQNKLVNEHLGLVHHVVDQMKRTMSYELERDELVSFGTMGLMSAARNFDPSRGFTFSTFAVPRIRGAILDGLRQQDEVPRSTRAKERAIERAENKLSGKIGRKPTTKELAEEMNMSIEKLHQWRLDKEVNNDGPSNTINLLADIRGESIEDQISQEQEVALVRKAIASLTKRQQEILSLHYDQDLNLEEIAQKLGVTPSNISQIKKYALEKLRSELKHLRQ